MTIYIFVLFGVVFFALVFPKNRKRYCISVGVILYLVCALRSVNIGLYDTAGVYYRIFISSANRDISEILQIEQLKQIPFILTTKFLKLFIHDYHIYIAVIAIPFIAFTMYIIYKYSDYPMLSTLFFISLYYLYSFFLLRQVIAMAIVFFSYRYLKDSNLKKYVLTILVATLFQQTAIISLIAYPFCKINKFGFKNYLFIGICFLIGKFLPDFIYRIIGLYSPQIIGYIRTGIYDSSGEISMFGLLITVATLMYAHFFKSKINGYKEDMLYNISSLGSMIFCFSSIVTEFYRAALYFSIFNVLLVSNCGIIKQKKDTRALVRVVISILLILYFLIRTVNNTNANPYMFFWSDSL